MQLRIPRNRGDLAHNRYWLHWNAVILLETLQRTIAATPHSWPLYEAQYTALQAHINAMQRLRGGWYSPDTRPIDWPR